MYAWLLPVIISMLNALSSHGHSTSQGLAGLRGREHREAFSLSMNITNSTPESQTVSIASIMPGDNETLGLEIVKEEGKILIAKANNTLGGNKSNLSSVTITDNGSPVIDTRYENIFDLAERLRRNIIHSLRKIEWHLKSLFGRRKREPAVYSTKGGSDEVEGPHGGNTQSNATLVDGVENREGSSNSSRRMQTQERRGAEGLFLGSGKKEHTMQGMEPVQGRDKKRLRGKVGTKDAKVLRKHDKPVT